MVHKGALLRVLDGRTKQKFIISVKYCVFRKVGSHQCAMSGLTCSIDLPEVDVPPEKRPAFRNLSYWYITCMYILQTAQ